MTTVPEVLPTVTVPAATVASVTLLLLQEPPVVASVRYIVVPVHAVDGPVITAGDGFTVIVPVVSASGMQPVDAVQVTIVVPGPA